MIEEGRGYYSRKQVVDKYDSGRISSARGRMRYGLQQKLLYEMLPKPPASVIEIGCGTGIFTRRSIEQGFQITVVEPSEAMIEACCQRLSESNLNAGIVRANGVSLPFADGQFSAAYCLNVLSHIREPITIVAEMTRVIRPGGVVVFNFPNLSSPAGILIHWIINPLRRILKKQKVYTHYYLVRRLLNQCAKLPVTIIRRTGLFPLDWRLYRMNPSSSQIKRIEDREWKIAKKDLLYCCSQAWIALRKDKPLQCDSAS